MKVVAVYNMKGGVGKSTTAVNLAYLSASSGARTLLWDLDAQAASTFAFRVQPEVAGFGKRSLERVDRLLDAIKGTDYDNLDLLPADFAYRKLDRFLERVGQPDRGWRKPCGSLVTATRDVFLDCPAGFSLLTQNVLGAADVVLVPTIPTVLSLRTLVRLVHVHGPIWAGGAPDHLSQPGRSTQEPAPAHCGLGGGVSRVLPARPGAVRQRRGTDERPPYASVGRGASGPCDGGI